MPVSFKPTIFRCAASVCILLTSLTSFASSNARIIATGGGTMLEGSAGGGLVPWAILSGYSDEDEFGGALGISHVKAKDFSLDAAAIAINWHNRIELSFARQRFDIDKVAAGEHLQQDIVGAKVRLAGDLVYTRVPQIAFGIQYKRNSSFTIPNAVGALDDNDIDVYLTASKVWLNGPFNRSVLASGTLRATRANQLGLLGFGGDNNRDHELMLEVSAGLFFNRHWVIGAEYRQKPDNLGALKEDDWQDVFIGWFPNKRVSVVLAWAGLGSIAGFDNQDSYYLSVQLSQ
ncbi:MAG: DUF3034 family protein [Granulosicoccus sp.]